MQGKLTVDNEEVKEVEDVGDVMKKCGSAEVEEGSSARPGCPETGRG